MREKRRGEAISVLSNLMGRNESFREGGGGKPQVWSNQKREKTHPLTDSSSPKWGGSDHLKKNKKKKRGEYNPFPLLGGEKE